MKRVLCFCVIVLILQSLSGCAKYRESEFLGKSSAQIEAEFGPFDCVSRDKGADGLYRNASCGYTVRAPQKGFLGTSPERLFFISFDENGVAVSCREGYRPGG